MDLSNKNFTIFLAILLVLAMQLYALLSGYRRTKDVRERFLQQNENYEVFNDAKALLTCFGILIILLIGLAIFNIKAADDIWLTIDYFGTAVFALTTSFFMYEKRICYLGEKEFYVDGKVARYSQLLSAEKKAGISSNYIVKTSTGEITVPRGIANVLMKRKKTGRKLTKKYTK